MTRKDGQYRIVGAAWANAAAYAIQAAIAFRFSQRFYPIPYERGRIVRAVGAALLGYASAWLVPDLPALPGGLTRGTTVLLVTGSSLWATGFFNAAELQWLRSLWGHRARREPITTAPDSTEMGGEIVSVDVPDTVIPPRDADSPQKR